VTVRGDRVRFAGRRASDGRHAATECARIVMLRHPRWRCASIRYWWARFDGSVASRCAERCRQWMKA